MTDRDDLSVIDERMLPPQIRELVREIGMAETLTLLQERGGTPLYVAQQAELSSLNEFLRPESVAALAAKYGRERLDLPKADKLVQQIRNHYVRETRARGIKSGRQLARELGLSWRMIKYITNGMPDATDSSDQGELSL